MRGSGVLGKANPREDVSGVFAFLGVQHRPAGTNPTGRRCRAVHGGAERVFTSDAASARSGREVYAAGLTGHVPGGDDCQSPCRGQSTRRSVERLVWLALIARQVNVPGENREQSTPATW